MTGGRVVIFGTVGKNFAAGMSGGIAYVLADNAEQFMRMANREMVLFEALEDVEEIREVYQMIFRHYQYTNSPKAAQLLADWDSFIPKFVKVIPKNYKRMMEAIAAMERSGLSKEQALFSAFEAVAKQKNISPLEAVAK